jgi:hypothetical protein
MRVPSLIALFALVAAPVTSWAAPQTPPVQTPVQQAAPPPPPPVPKGVIAGKVVVQTTDAPIARARVVLSAAEDVLPFNRVVVTAADGTFRFTDLPIGTSYVVTASKTGFAARAYGEGPPATPPALIALTDAEVKQDLQIALPAHVFISGRVLDEDGQPFAGALVEAMRAVFDQGRRTLVTIADATTDERGEFRLVGLSPGQYYVSAFDPAFANVGDKDGQLFYSPTFYPGVVFPDEAGRITLDSGTASERIEFKLRLIKPARVAGNITTPAEGGVPRPLLAAAVIMSPMRNDQFSLFTTTEPTMRPNGDFLFANVPAGRYRIQARGETEREGVTRFSLFTLPVDGTDVRDIDMWLQPGAIVSGTAEWVSERGRRPPSTTDIVVRAPMEDGSLFGDAVTGYLGANDQWTINGVMAGRHFIRVQGLPEGWELARVEYQGADITDQPWTFDYKEVKPGFRLVFTDVQTIVRGWVTPPRRDDIQSFAVVAFTANSVHWRPNSRHVELTYPDALGRYEIRGLPAGNYMVAATRDVDISDLGNPKTFDRLAALRTTVSFSLRPGQIVRQDVVPSFRQQ